MFWNSKILNWLRLLAILLLVFFSLQAAIKYLGDQKGTWKQADLTDDPVTNWEARCAQLRQDLPRIGDVGYISDWDIPGWNGGLSDMDNEYRLTQYALVPHILIRGGGYDEVVGNLSDPESIGTMEKQFGLKMVHSYGLGIYLFKKAAP